MSELVEGLTRGARATVHSPRGRHSCRRQWERLPLELGKRGPSMERNFGNVRNPQKSKEESRYMVTWLHRDTACVTLQSSPGWLYRGDFIFHSPSRQSSNFGVQPGELVWYRFGLGLPDLANKNTGCLGPPWWRSG